MKGYTRQQCLVVMVKQPDQISYEYKISTKDGTVICTDSDFIEALKVSRNKARELNQTTFIHKESTLLATSLCK